MEKQLAPYAFLEALQHLRKLDWNKKLTIATMPEFLALSAIHYGQVSQPDKPGVYVSRLAEELMTSVSMVSKMLKILESKGWILRTIDPGSRRNTFVSLTEEGSRVYAEACRQVEAVHEAVVERIGLETMHQFLTLSSGLAAAYEEALS